MSFGKSSRPIYSVIGACALLAASLVWNYYAGQYAAARGRDQPSLTADLLLKALPYDPMQATFVWGFAAFVLAALIGCRLERRRTTYFVGMYAALISLRAVFITLTPMGMPPGAVRPDGDPLFDLFGERLTFGNDLFFSSHASLPFLGFLIFDRLGTRLVMFAFTVLLTSCTLIGRYHYTIDVAAAFFITYALVQGHARWARRWGAVSQLPANLTA